MWWCTPAISALGGLQWEDCKFEVSLGYVVKPHLNKHPKLNNSNKTLCFCPPPHIFQGIFRAGLRGQASGGSMLPHPPLSCRSPTS